MRHPWPRLGSVLEGTISLAALALLVRFRPDWPQLPRSLSAPVTTVMVQQFVLVAAWLLSGLLVLLSLARAIVGLVAPVPRREPPMPHLAATLVARTRPAPLTPQTMPIQLFPLIPRPRTERLPDDPGERHSRVPRNVRADRAAGSIALLGPLEIITSTPRQRGPRSKTKEVLAYLALHPKGAALDDLAVAVWPDLDDDKARTDVWRAISDTRSQLGDVFLRAGDQYQLDRAALTIDVDEFDFLLAQASVDCDAAREQLLERALTLVRGHPLAGSDYPWANGDLHHLRARIIGLLHELGEVRLTDGDTAGALALAERAIGYDPDDESAQRLAMRAEAALGLKEAVMERYEQLSKRLDERFGLEPERPTRLLYKHLLSQDTTSAEKSAVSGHHRRQRQSSLPPETPSPANPKARRT